MPQLAPVQPTTVIEQTHPCSLPIPSEGDALFSDKLDEYFAWLTKLNPAKADGLARCLQTLKEQDIVIGIVDKVQDDLFDSWGISHGLRILVKTHVSKWLHAKTKKHI
jgi:hypothetical protein